VNEKKWLIYNKEKKRQAMNKKQMLIKVFFSQILF
jgi:hypothetical protein